MPDLSISIINTNNRDIALQCLRSVYEMAGSLELEVFVVNNACTDGSTQAIQQELPQVRIIKTERMQGFSTNNNLALAQASGRYWMLLNDDTIVQPGAFQTMVKFMDEHQVVGVAGACLLNPDRSFQYCYDFTPNPFYEGLRPFSEMLRPIRRSEWEPLAVGNVSGACIMVRAEAAEKVGHLDTRFDPLYSEEIDWCYRFQQAGWKIFHIPQAKVIHLGVVKNRRTSLTRYERIYANKTIFFRKHQGPWAATLYKMCLFVSSLIKIIRWSGASIQGKADAQQQIKVHLNIIHKVWGF